MTTEANSNRLLSKIVESSPSLAEIYERVDDYCKTCRTPSPMTCVEECELWKVKNEVLRLNEIVNGDDHLSDLFSAIKSERRLRILDELSRQSRSTKELQQHLKNHGYYHSRQTINEYIKPLVNAGLAKEEGKKYALTVYGRKIHDVVKKFNLNNLLPTRSSCYEEVVLLELANGPKTREELLRSVPFKSLPRAIRRLHRRKLIIKNKPSDYVFYFKNRANNRLSPTEKRVFTAISDVGTSARQLSKEVGINLRRTYLYLRRLREKKLIFAKEMPMAYELTINGRKLADFLGAMTHVALSASNASTVILRRHPNVAARLNRQAR